jgi:hypothetical protein
MDCDHWQIWGNVQSPIINRGFWTLPISFPSFFWHWEDDAWSEASTPEGSEESGASAEYQTCGMNFWSERSKIIDSSRQVNYRSQFFGHSHHVISIPFGIHSESPETCPIYRPTTPWRYLKMSRCPIYPCWGPEGTVHLWTIWNQSTLKPLGECPISQALGSIKVHIFII